MAENKFIPLATPIASNKLQQLVVIAVISNPVRYKSRYELYRKFEKAMSEAGALMITVEMAFGERPFQITERDNPIHCQVRAKDGDELWHKENLGNIGLNYAAQIFPDFKYVAFIDADVLPMGNVQAWLEETVEQLQHYHVVQMFETAFDLGPDGQVIAGPMESFMSRYIKSGCVLPKRGGYWEADHYHQLHGHPGYAWAYTREALDSVGGLIDFAILGAGDRHMALGWVGCMDQSFEHLNANYRNHLMQWQERAERWVKRDVGYVKGSLYHFFHGKKKDRGYTDRWKILRDCEYNPLLDIKKDAQGLMILETWEPRQMNLRDRLRAYTRSRNEDSIDL